MQPYRERVRGPRGRTRGLVAMVFLTSAITAALSAVPVGAADWPPSRRVPAVFAQLTLEHPILGLSVEDRSYDLFRPGTTGIGPACWRATRDTCRQSWGVERVELRDSADLARGITIGTINGPPGWRALLSRITVATFPVVARGHAAVYIPRTGASGDFHSVEWAEHGVNVFVQSQGSGFTTSELLTIANSLEIKRVTRDALVPIAKVAGHPPHGSFNHPKGSSPGSYVWLLADLNGAGPCFAFSPGGECGHVLRNRRMGVVAQNGDYYNATAGFVAVDADTVRVRYKTGRPFDFEPLSVGPRPSIRYFAHWLPRRFDAEIEAVEAWRDGQLISRIKLSN